MGEEGEKNMFNLAEEIRKLVRVMQVASRPRLRDFERMAMVTGAGILFMGLIGLVISFILNIK